MNHKLTAALLIVAAVLTNAAFTVLGTVFNYPDILGEPVEDILAAFRAHQTAVVGWFAVMALSAALFAPIAIGVGRLSSNRAMRIAVPVGIARRWFTVLGVVSAVPILGGVLVPLQLPLVDDGNFIGYILWSVWLVIFAIIILRVGRSRVADAQPVQANTAEPVTS